MELVYSYNPRQQYDWEFADIVVSQLNKMNYKAEADMGISQMRILSNASKEAVEIALSKSEEIFFK